MTKREKVLQGLKECTCEGAGECGFEPNDNPKCPYSASTDNCARDMMLDALELLKDPDRVKIVRCEDCECWTANNDEEGDNSGVCTNFGHSITTDGTWFCADGKERDEG